MDGRRKIAVTDLPQTSNGGLVGIGDTVEGVGSGLREHAQVERLLGELVAGWVM